MEKNRKTTVAPYVGAWSETFEHLHNYLPSEVAPYVGAWIETNRSTKRLLLATVAPYVGAWIETLVKSRSCVGGYRRTLCGCVD